MKRLLLIDDDKEFSDLLTEYLSSEGFLVDHAYDGKQGVDKAISSNYDLIILDLMLPVMSGSEAIVKIQKSTTTPVLMLTARGDETSRIIGLEIGADDYMGKPCNPRELTARIRAILRRVSKKTDQGREGQDLDYDGLIVKPRSRIVTKGGKPIDMTQTEFNILLYLMESANEVVTKNEISQHIQGQALKRFDRTIDMHVSNIRKKIGKKEDEAEYIRTVRSVGYIFETGHV